MSRVRLALAIVGFLLAIVGVLRDDRRVVWAAIAVIGALVAVRMIAARKSPSR